MLARQILLYLPAQVIGPLFQFAAMIAWTYWLAPEALGVVALVQASQELLQAVSIGWFSFYTLRFYPGLQEDERRRAYLDTEMFVLAASTIATAIATIGVLLLLKEARVTWALVLTAMAFTVTRGLGAHLGERARSTEDITTYTIVQVVGPVAGLALSYLGVQQLGRDPHVILGGYALAQGVALVWALWRVELGRRLLHLDREIGRAAVRYGSAFLAGMVLAWVSANAIRVVVEAIDGTSAVGLVSVGWGLGQRASIFSSMLVTAAAFPIVMRRARERGEQAGLEQIGRNGAVLLMILAPAMGGIWVLAEPLCRLLVAPSFVAVTVAILPAAFLVGALRNLRFHWPNHVHFLFERPWVPVAIDAVDAVTTVLGCWIGLKLGGLTGAALGAIPGAALGLALNLGIAMWAHGFRPPWLALARVLLAAGLMTAVLAALPPPASLGAVIAHVALGTAVYGAVLMALFPRLVKHGLELARSSRSANG